MRKYLPVSGVLLLLLSLHSAAYAGGISNEEYAAALMTGVELGSFDDNLTYIAEGIISAGRVIAVIMTAVSGIMVTCNLHDANKTLWSWILGIGLALNFADVMSTVWSGYLQPMQTVTPEEYEFRLIDASDPDVNILGSFMMYYIRNIILPGAQALAPIAMRIILLLTLINACIRLSMDLVSGDKVKFMLSTFLETGFYLFLIQNWLGGINLMASLSQGFENMALIAAGSDYSMLGDDPTSTSLRPDSIVDNALIIWNTIWAQISDNGLSNITVSIVSIICAFSTVLVLFVTALDMFIVRIEFYIMALITLMLLPFGVIPQLKFLSEKAIGAMFNLAIKVFVIALLTVVSNKILYRMTVDITEAAEVSDFVGNISLLLQILLTALIIMFLVRKIPDLIQGLLSGNPSLSGGSMSQMAMDTVNKGSGAAGVAKGALSQGYRQSGMQEAVQAGYMSGGELGAAGAALRNTPAMTMATAGLTMKAGIRSMPAYQAFMEGQKKITMAGANEKCELDAIDVGSCIKKENATQKEDRMKMKFENLDKSKK